MDVDAGVADLHMHTTASDGTDSVHDRLRQARQRNLDIIAITDHDRISEFFSARRTSVDGLEVVTGVEVRADIDDTKVEILGYFVDPTNSELVDVLERARQYRIGRNREMVGRLNADLDVKLEYERLREEADGQLGRPDLARALLAAGIVDSIEEGFDRYLGPDGSAYVPMERVPHEEVLGAVRSAGGVSSLAHPGRIRADQDRALELIETLADAGLDAIEVWYPYGRAHEDSSYAGFTVEDAASLADELDLLSTGGSDCHGTGSDKYRIGDVRIEERYFDLLEERGQDRQDFEE